MEQLATHVAAAQATVLGAGLEADAQPWEEADWGAPGEGEDEEADPDEDMPEVDNQQTGTRSPEVAGFVKNRNTSEVSQCPTQ